MLETCYTVLSSLVADWQATGQLFARGLGALELNPVVRAVGPDPYFGILTLAGAGTCASWPAWAAAALWAAQTWAVNTHTALGTVISFPQLVLWWRW